MKKIYIDFLVVATFIMMMLSLWSGASTSSMSIRLLIGMFLGVLLANIYFICRREMTHDVERIAYVYSFSILSSIVIAILIIDDFPVISGILYLFLATCVISLLAFVMLKWKYLQKLSLVKQNLIMWFVSFVFIILSLIAATY